MTQLPNSDPMTDPVHGAHLRHLRKFDADTAQPVEARAYSHGYTDGFDAALDLPADHCLLDGLEERPVIRQVLAAELRKLTDLLRTPQVWADPMGAWSAGEADAARAMKAHLLRLVSMRAAELGAAGATVQTADTVDGGTS